MKHALTTGLICVSLICAGGFGCHHKQRVRHAGGACPTGNCGGCADGSCQSGCANGNCKSGGKHRLFGWLRKHKSDQNACANENCGSSGKHHLFGWLHKHKHDSATMSADQAAAASGQATYPYYTLRGPRDYLQP